MTINRQSEPKPLPAPAKNPLLELLEEKKEIMKAVRAGIVGAGSIDLA